MLAAVGTATLLALVASAGVWSPGRRAPDREVMSDFFAGSPAALTYEDATGFEAYMLYAVTGHSGGGALARLEATPWWGSWNTALRSARAAAAASGNATVVARCGRAACGPSRCNSPFFAVRVLRSPGQTSILGLCWQAAAPGAPVRVTGLRAVAWPNPGTNFAAAEPLEDHQREPKCLLRMRFGLPTPASVDGGRLRVL